MSYTESCSEVSRMSCEKIVDSWTCEQDDTIYDNAALVSVNSLISNDDLVVFDELDITFVSFSNPRDKNKALIYIADPENMTTKY